MASSQHSLPPDVQENIVHNIQKIFPHYVDKKVIKAVLNRECWDLEKSLDFLKSSLQSYSENPNSTKKKDIKAKKIHKGPLNVKQNKSNSNASGSNKPPALLKNFKKNTKSKKKQQANKEKPSENIVEGDWILLNENKSNPRSGSKSDLSKSTAKEPSVENKAQSNDNRLAKRKKMNQHYEIIKQFGEPLNRISAYINGGIRVMILLRGCSGSGKTTFANQILKKHGAKNPQAHIFSTDNFFVSKEGKYTFNYDLLQTAHEWNQKLVRLAASEGRSPIFVDNTNTRLWEMKEYALLAVEFGFVLEILEPPTPWFFSEDMLVRKTLHGVSRDSIKKMLDRYEANISGDDVLRALKLNYSSLAPPQGVMAGLDVPMSKKHIKLFNEKLSAESSNINKGGQSAKSVPSKKSFVKPPDVPTQFRQPRHLENIDNVYNRPIRNPIDNSTHFQPMPINNPIRFDAPSTLGGHFPPRPNHFMDQNHFGMQNQQTRLYPDLYSHMDGNRMSAAIPNLFNSQYSPRFLPPSYNGPNSATGPSLPSSSSKPCREYLSNINSDPGYIMSPKPSYVDDLIDLTIPANVEQSAINESSVLSNDMSSSISLLEGLKIDEGLLDQSETDSDEGDDDCSSDDTSESDNYTDAGSSIANQSCDQQSLLEYVLITEDNKIVFQKYHEELEDISSLEDFRKTDSNLVTSFPNNFEEFLINYMENSKSGIKGDEMSESYFSIKTNNACSQNKTDNNLPEFLSNGGQNQKTVSETSLEHWNRDVLTTELPTSGPKEQRTKLDEICKKISSLSVTTNTNYLDFEILRKVNNGLEIENTKILLGKPCFVSEMCKTSCEPVTVLMLDKGVMTSDIETSQVVVRDCGLERLALMFPNVSRENIEELFDNCQKDIDWTVGILLDSGQEMSELYTSLEPIECSNQDNKILNTPGPSTRNETDILQGEIKKLKKKKNEFDANKYKEIQDKIQSNFVLGENHYSEKMKKHIERKHKIQIGPSSEAAPVQVDESVLDEESFNSDNLEGSEAEDDVVFMLDSDFIFQLQSRFGGLLRPNMIGERTVISLPSNLARQLHNCIMDSIQQQIEEEDIFTTDDSLLTKDEELARNLQDEELKSRGVPSLVEIMDEEVALRKSQGPKDNSNGKSMASRLSKQLLIERFPLMDPATLALILEDTNHSLHEATCLLSSAGHFPADAKLQAAQNDTIVESEKNALSREEAIKQADAYGDIASKLYELRKDCLKKSAQAYREGNHSVALYYSDMAKWYMERIEKSNSLAAKAILSGYEGWTTLDLHFLQVSEALNVLDLFVDEVIRGLQESKNKKTIVYIITGRGLHSAGGRPRLKPAVQSRLSKRDLRYAEHNPGMLRVIIPRTALTSYNREVAATCA